MHLCEIICLWGATVISIYILEYSWFGSHIPVSYFVCVYAKCEHPSLQFRHNNARNPFLSCHDPITAPRNRWIGHWCEFLYPFPLLRSLVRHLIIWPKKKWPTEYGINSNPVPADSIKQFFYLFKKKEIEERMRSVSACNCFSIEYEILPSNDSFDLLTSR